MWCWDPARVSELVERNPLRPRDVADGAGEGEGGQLRDIHRDRSGRKARTMGRQSSRAPQGGRSSQPTGLGLGRYESVRGLSPRGQSGGMQAMGSGRTNDAVDAAILRLDTREVTVLERLSSQDHGVHIAHSPVVSELEVPDPAAGPESQRGYSPGRNGGDHIANTVTWT